MIIPFCECIIIIHSSIDGYSSIFQFEVIVIHAAVNILEHVFRWTYAHISVE